MREELDFKSLRFFSALYRLGNVSPAADALDISQPTGSLLLKKLRDHFAAVSYTHLTLPTNSLV